MSYPDALLYHSFGGPESADEVMPFLRRVAQGRNIPEKRLAHVAEHYYACGGFSPINRDNREIISRLKNLCASENIPTQVYFGNRNSAPFITDTLETIIADGHHSVYVFRTSAWGGFSGRTQYLNEVITVLDQKTDAQLRTVFSSEYYDQPRFIHGYANSTRAAMRELSVYSPSKIAVIFTAHSVPCTTISGYQLYEQQVNQTCAAVARAVGLTDYTIAWQSRSGSPQTPWLEPDILDVITHCSDKGYQAVCVVPVGFITDHMEVIWDLDHEASQHARQLQLGFSRAHTIGVTDNFVQMIIDLMRHDMGIAVN